MAMKALVEPSGRVAQIEDEANVFDVVEPFVWIEVPADATPEWSYDKDTGKFLPPPPPVAPTAEQVRADRDARSAAASIRLQPLNDAKELGEITDAESALRLKLMKYRVDLSRIEAQVDFPAVVAWPVVPL